MATYIFLFLKHFISIRTLATTDRKLYRRTNASTSGSFTAKDFFVTWSAAAIKSPKLQMKMSFSALKVTLSFLLELFDVNEFESGNSEDKDYKIESFGSEINLQK